MRSEIPREAMVAFCSAGGARDRMREWLGRAWWSRRSIRRAGTVRNGSEVGCRARSRVLLKDERRPPRASVTMLPRESGRGRRSRSLARGGCGSAFFAARAPVVFSRPWLRISSARLGVRCGRRRVVGRLSRPLGESDPYAGRCFPSGRSPCVPGRRRSAMRGLRGATTVRRLRIGRRSVASACPMRLQNWIEVDRSPVRVGTSRPEVLDR